MRNLPTREKCCGCTACASICPKSAIIMRVDEEGFAQPFVDDHVCVNCGLCERACPVLNQGIPRKPISCHVAKSLDDDERMRSSSGGVFSLLARFILSKGGRVYGVAWERSRFKAVHIGVDVVDDLGKLRGSKYVQSDLGDTFVNVKNELQKGRMVLFSGCPCQVAGLYAFLGRNYENLITQEVICNSVPSPRALDAWVKAESKKVPGEELVNIVFRDKSCGWHNTALKFLFTTTTTTNLQYSAYYKLWQQGYTVRRSCIDCAFRDFKSGADLTIGDFWGIEDIRPGYDDNKGVSAVLINTDKGEKLWNEIRHNVINDEVSYDDVVVKNPCLHKSFDILRCAGNKRGLFWAKINKGADIQAEGVKLFKEPLSLRARHIVGRCLRKMGLRK